jgi:hypothetical protein
VREGLTALRDARLDVSLAEDEVAALKERISIFLESGHYPPPASPYSYPWPPV